MKELTMDECETTSGGLPPLIVAIFGLAGVWIDRNWKDIKQGAVDGWREAAF